MPSPLLVTLISTSAWRSSTVTVTRPPSGVYRDAFCKRFASTWASSSGRLRAPIAFGRRISTLMRRRSNAGRARSTAERTAAARSTVMGACGGIPESPSASKSSE